MEDLTCVTEGQVSWELPLTIEFLFLFPTSNAFIEDFFQAIPNYWFSIIYKSPLKYFG